MDKKAKLSEAATRALQDPSTSFMDQVMIEAKRLFGLRKVPQPAAEVKTETRQAPDNRR